MSAWAGLVAWLDPDWCGVSVPNEAVEPTWEPEDDSGAICDEDCDRNGGSARCKCYGTVEETTEGGW